MGKGVSKPRQRACAFCEADFTYTNAASKHCSRLCLFWSKVDMQGIGKCWPWTGGSQVRGYGRFYGSSSPRVAWQMANGPMPSELFACHSCDNPSCCNPKHIWPGTPKENTQDSIRKLRRVGEGMGRNKLTNIDVLNIKDRLLAGDLPSDIANSYGVNLSTVLRIRQGSNWAHLTGGPIVRSQSAQRRMIGLVVERQQSGCAAIRRPK
ncbi:hypothetical protein FHT01_002331 [Sphingomonas japonica]|uniref:HNH nuclease domain-containing protein n=2 Tax=Sphingomonas japonica TaxID=511662 RepID=A0ABX0U2R7_9SPHN|nr:hypothetical protein [Sphingomonas japonica]